MQGAVQSVHEPIWVFALSGLSNLNERMNKSGEAPPVQVEVHGASWHKRQRELSSIHEYFENTKSRLLLSNILL